MPEAKGQKTEHPSAHGCRSTSPTSCWIQETNKESVAHHSPLRRKWRSMALKAKRNCMYQHSQRNSTNDLKATHKGAKTPPGLQFKIFSIYAGSCYYNLRGKAQGTDTHIPTCRFMLTTVPVKLLKQVISYMSSLWFDTSLQENYYLPVDPHVSSMLTRS